MLVFVGLVLSLITVAGAKEDVGIPNEEEYLNLYQKFQARYGKDSDSQSYSFFRRNVLTAMELNRLEGVNCTDLFELKGDCVHGINGFSDMDPEEFRATMQGGTKELSNDTDMDTDKDIVTNTDKDAGPGTSVDRPARWDPRDYGWVSPIKSQYPCGICWAFAAVEVVETHYARAANSWVPTFSVEQVVDCGSKGGCTHNAGMAIQAFRYWKSAGVALESTYPTTIMSTRQRQSCRRAGASAHVRDYFEIKKFAWLPIQFGKPSEDQIADEVYAHGPVAVAVDSKTVPWQHYTGSVMSRCGRGMDHSVTVIGYDRGSNAYGKPYWIVRNHWGSYWGISGYIYLEYGKDMCAITQRPASVRMQGEAATLVV